MMVWVLRKELEYKVEKLKHKEVGGHAPYKDQNQIRTSRVLVNEPFCLSPHQSFTVDIDYTVYHLLVKMGSWWRIIRGREGALINFLPQKRGGGAYCGEVAYLSAPGLLEIEKGA